MRDITFILFFIPFLVLIFRSPFTGLCTWVWFILSVPKGNLFGIAGDIRYIYIVAFITIFMMLLKKDKFRGTPSSGLFFVMVIFLFQTAISNIGSIGDAAISWYVWSDFFKAILMCFLMLIMLTTKVRINAFVVAMLLGIGFNIFVEGAKFLVTGGGYKVRGIAHSMMTDNNLFALSILMVIPLFLYMIPMVKGKYTKLSFITLTGFSIISVIGSFSRGGFVGLLVVFWQNFWKSNHKTLLLTFSLIFGLVAINIASDKWSQRMDSIESAVDDKSFSGRVTAWKIATIAAMDNPILGTGQDSIQHGHVWRLYYSDIRDFDFIPTINTPIDVPKAAHSIYFQVLGDAGFLGLFLFLIIL